MSFGFYVKSIEERLEVLKLPFGKFQHSKSAKFYRNQYSDPQN